MPREYVVDSAEQCPDDQPQADEATLMHEPCPLVDGLGVGEPGQVFEDLLATPIVQEPAVQGKGVRGLGSVASAVVDRFPELHMASYGV